MAIEQNINGKWRINVHHTCGDDVEIPVKLTYKGDSASTISFIITQTPQVIETNWETPLGIEPDKNDITVDSQPWYSEDGSKRYIVTDAFWSFSPYSADITHQVLISPSAYTGTESSGVCGFKAYYLTLSDGVETNRQNVTSDAEWVTSGANSSRLIVDGCVVTYNNTTSTTRTANIWAKYGDATGNAKIKMPASGPEPEDTPVTAYGDLIQINE